MAHKEINIYTTNHATSAIQTLISTYLALLGIDAKVHPFRVGQAIRNSPTETGCFSFFTSEDGWWYGEWENRHDPYSTFSSFSEEEARKILLSFGSVDTLKLGLASAKNGNVLVEFITEFAAGYG